MKSVWDDIPMITDEELIAIVQAASPDAVPLEELLREAYPDGDPLEELLREDLPLEESNADETEKGRDTHDSEKEKQHN